MEFYKLTFFESAKLLAERYNIIIDISDNYSSSNEYSFLKAVHEDAALIFQQNLFSDIGKEPLQYLKKRNLTEEIIRKFRIGFAIDSWNGLVNKISLILPFFKNLAQTGDYVTQKRLEGRPCSYLSIEYR